MDRRSFLSRTAVGAGALAVGASSPGCGGLPAHPGLAGSEAEELLARLDRGLSTLRSVPAGDIARELRGLPRPDVAEHVLRITLEGLVVTDVMRSLPGRGAGSWGAVPASLVGPLASATPLLERSVSTHYAMLSAMPPSTKRNLDRKLRASPSAMMDVAEWIDGHAARLGVAPASRLALREKASGAATRMRRQSASAVIDDAVEKVGRVAAPSGASLARARSASSHAMIEAIWQQIDGTAGAGLGSPQGGWSEPRSGAEDRGLQDLEWAAFTEPPGPVRWSARWGRPGDEEQMIGSILMPFGLVSCGLMLIIGLIVLVAGTVQNAEWDGRPRAQ